MGRCLVCGREADAGLSFGPKGPRAKVCLTDAMRFSDSPEGQRVAAIRGKGAVSSARRAAAFVDHLNRVLAERRNHGNAAVGSTP